MISRRLACRRRAVRLDTPLLTRSSPLDLTIPPLLGLAAALAALAGAMAAAAALSALGRLLGFNNSDDDDDDDARQATTRPPRASAAAAAQGTGGSAASPTADDDAAGPPEWVANLRHLYRLRAGNVRAAWDSVKYLWSEAFFDEDAVTTLPDAWAPCLLEAREEADGYVLYRFALKAGPKHALPLELGQAVSAMCFDSKNRIARADSLWPASSRRDDSGVIEIVAPSRERAESRFAEGAMDAETRDLFAALDALPVGTGEVAVRPGRRAFQSPQGDYLPITSFQCFVEDLGAVPVMQILRESLPRGRSTVDKADVFWINAHQDDFALYESLEDVYYTFNRKMTISCVLDEDLFVAENAASKAAADDAAADTAASSSAPTAPALARTAPAGPPPPTGTVFDRNDDLREAVQPWQPGALAIVAGASKFATEISNHLTQVLGYPSECILVF